MSKVTPSALRGLSVAAGTVGLAAVGAAAMAGQACAAESGVSGLAGGGLPVSTNAVPAVFGAVAHNHGTIAGIPLSGLPVLSQLPGMMDDASPVSDALPGLGYADLGELPVTRSRVAEPQRAAYVPQHAAVHAAHAIHADPATTAPAPAAPAQTPSPAAAPAAPMPQAPAQAPTQLPPAQAAAAKAGPLDNVTNALHGLPIAGQLAGPGGSLPVVGGLTGGGSPLGGLGGLGGLTGGLSDLGG
jgi:preprotein translocase subunit SecG